MQFQKPKNPSAEKHSQWQVRHIVGMAVHVGLGGTAQLFQFRKKDEHAVFDFVLLAQDLGWENNWERVRPVFQAQLNFSPGRENW